MVFIGLENKLRKEKGWKSERSILNRLHPAFSYNEFHHCQCVYQLFSGEQCKNSISNLEAQGCWWIAIAECTVTKVYWCRKGLLRWVDSDFKWTWNVELKRLTGCSKIIIVMQAPPSPSPPTPLMKEFFRTNLTLWNPEWKGCLPAPWHVSLWTEWPAFHSRCKIITWKRQMEERWFSETQNP